MSFVKQISEVFWSPSFWLPPNITWVDIASGSRSDINFPDYKQLWWPLPMTIVLLAIRYCTEKYIVSPIGKSLGIKSTRYKRAKPNPILETAFNRSNKRWERKTIIGLAKRVDLTEREIERWCRYRRAQTIPTKLVKFCESSWRCLYYTFSFTYGLMVLWNKPWFWDINHCWYDYPHQSIDTDIWFYYMFSMAFYWSLMVSQFFDIKHNDFWLMFVHHVATLLLLTLSWICNFHRVGALVLVIHDCADIFLDATKIAKYANYQKLCDTLSAVFTIAWLVTRLGFYPRVIYSTTIEAPRIIDAPMAYYVFNSMLILLLCIHIVWTFIILKAIYKAIKVGKIEGDTRSSSSELSGSSDSSENEQK